MAFYRPDSAMQAQLAGLLDRLAAENRPGLHNSVAVSWVVSVVALPAETLLSSMFPIAGVLFIVVNVGILSFLRKMPKTVR